MKTEIMRLQKDETRPEQTGRLLLGAMLVNAGISHLTYARDDFKAQVPPWLPMETDAVVLASGGVEIALGGALVILPRRRVLIGRIAGAFFLAVFPGNIAQWTHHRSAFGLNSDRARFIRLLFQPLLVAWALWSTSAWRRTRQKRLR